MQICWYMTTTHLGSCQDGEYNDSSQRWQTNMKHSPLSVWQVLNNKSLNHFSASLSFVNQTLKSSRRLKKLCNCATRKEFNRQSTINWSIIQPCRDPFSHPAFGPFEYFDSTTNRNLKTLKYSRILSLWISFSASCEQFFNLFRWFLWDNIESL
jgi:hypothetical protein